MQEDPGLGFVTEALHSVLRVAPEGPVRNRPHVSFGGDDDGADGDLDDPDSGAGPRVGL